MGGPSFIGGGAIGGASAGELVVLTEQFIVTTPNFWQDGRPIIVGSGVSATNHEVSMHRAFPFFLGVHVVGARNVP